jgi:addiction module RelE/StbE family toxin
MRLSQTHQFKKDIKRAIKRGKELAKLKAVIALLLSRKPLPPKNRDPKHGLFVEGKSHHGFGTMIVWGLP